MQFGIRNGVLRIGSEQGEDITLLSLYLPTRKHSLLAFELRNDCLQTGHEPFRNGKTLTFDFFLTGVNRLTVLTLKIFPGFCPYNI